MRLINHQQRAIARSQVPQPRMKPRIRQNHAGIRHHRLGQYRRHVARRQCALNPRQIIEFAAHCRQRQIRKLPQQPRPRRESLKDCLIVVLRERHDETSWSAIIAEAHRRADGEGL